MTPNPENIVEPLGCFFAYEWGVRYASAFDREKVERAAEELRRNGYHPSELRRRSDDGRFYVRF